jgi:uncharacterized phage protein (TIGR01671 family)
MRDYKFRGKRVDNGEWVYGSYCYNPLMKKGEIYSFDDKRCYVYRVDPATVGQYTGLHDKNGREIYEGDIVHCIAAWDNANMAVIFEEGEFHMVLCEKLKDYIPLCGFYCIRNFTKEIIGNIYEQEVTPNET